jgi:hypothetical protein
MRWLSFHLLVLCALGLISCSTVPEKMALAPLPAKWIVRTPASAKSMCSSFINLRPQGFFQLCSGSSLSKASGVVRFYSEDQKLLTELTVPTRDALALSASVSQESAWEQTDEHLFLGTQDGRILKFNHQGEMLGTYLLKMPTWVQHLRWQDGALFAIASRHESVTVLKLNDQLLPQQTLHLPGLESEAEWALGDKSFYVTSNTGQIYQMDYELKLLDQWSVGSERELGKPLFVNRSLWVGDSEGVVYKISSDRIQRAQLGVGPVSSAPVRTHAGLWVAFDEEGVLRLVDKNFKVVRSIKLPITRSFTGFESLSYKGHTLLRTSSQGIVTLLTAQGEVLISAEGEESQIEFAPGPEDSFAQERIPASGI